MPLSSIRHAARFAALAGSLCLAGASQRDSAITCAPDEVAGATYCADLIAIPELRSASGTLDLTPPPAPFGAAVDRNGVLRYRVAIRITGLPDPASLGRYRGYVAWATDLALDSTVRLGAVSNGRTELGTLAWNQYRVLVTAEQSADAKERAGRIVLRGTSPGVRLLAHRDAMVLGRAVPGSTWNGEGAPSAGHAHGGWTMPPMSSMMMMPALEGMHPSVRPFRAGEGVRDTAAVPLARPRSLLEVVDGDTIRLDARLVRRSIRGHTLLMYGFNGEQPGPLIRVPREATITVLFTNRIRLPTSVHWHGIRLDNRSDGVPGITQEAVAPGESFTYTIHVPDAGIYWYHPHVREDIQQDLGLYGNVLVTPERREYYGPANRDVVLTLDDLLLPDGDAPAYGDQAATHALMGRFGNVFLTNGEPDYHVTVRHGDVVRFHLTNVSSTRIYNLSFGAARMKLVGSDLGRFEREQWVESLVIAPAERYTFEVRFPVAGQIAVTNRVQAANHMTGSYVQEVDTVATITVDERATSLDLAAPFERLRTHDDVVADIARFRQSFDRAPDRVLDLRVTADLPQAILSTMTMGFAPPLDWNDGMPMLNWLATANDVKWKFVEPATGRENMDIRWRFRTGDVVMVRLRNIATSFHPMSHPIHMHGQRFLVLRRNGVAAENLVWKDTAIIPVGETVDLLVDLSNPGRWMLHCHIAEHLGAGMMMAFDVEPRVPPS